MLRMMPGCDILTALGSIQRVSSVLARLFTR
jgi:hypothetical protein